jgi:hypothetical protein
MTGIERFFKCAALALLGSAAAQAQTGAPVAVVELQADCHHVQGIDVAGDVLLVSSVERTARKGYLHRFALPSGKLLTRVEVQDGERYHPGGIALDGETIWVPVAEYRRASTSVIEQRDAASLRLLRRFPVDDHIGCLAVTPQGLIGGNWDSREVYFWDRAGKLVEKKANPSGNAFQDLKHHGGMLVGAGHLADGAGAVDWLTLPGLELHRRLPFGKTDRGVSYTHEGMAIRNGRLYLLPEDGRSRLFVFALSAP